MCACVIVSMGCCVCGMVTVWYSVYRYRYMCVIVPMGCYVCGIVTVWYTGACGDNRGNCRSIMWPGASKGQQGQRREGGWEITNFGSGKYKM